MIKAIIFDMDGVLVDSEPFHIELEKQQFLQYKLSVSNEEHAQYMGVASDVMWNQIAEHHSINVSAEDLIEQFKIKSIRYFSELGEIPVMPGLIDFLEKLSSKNFPMAVASSSYPEIIKIILEKTDIQKYFQVVVSSQEAGKSKPEPDVFLLAARKLGIPAKDCLVVEDSANGIKAAQAAGMSCVAYQGSGANPQSQKEADAIVSSFAQLAMMLI
jgi:beta-phosphoglucomutase family hydrolase